VPLAYQKTNAIFATPEKKDPGGRRRVLHLRFGSLQGMRGVRHRCGEHQALRMVQETEDVNAEHETGTAFLDLLPDTSQNTWASTTTRGRRIPRPRRSGTC
jgi:pyruvate-ferredoxin/flavodoxin oxidoreductase